MAGMEKRSCPRHYLFLRGSDHAVLARARTLWVYVDVRTGKAIPIPDEMRAAFPVIPDQQVSAHLGVDAAAARDAS